MKTEDVKKVFDANPKAKKVYVTSDGMPFINKAAAENHQATLNKNSGKAKELAVFVKDGKTVKKEGEGTGTGKGTGTGAGKKEGE